MEPGRLHLGSQRNAAGANGGRRTRDVQSFESEPEISGDSAPEVSHLKKAWNYYQSAILHPPKLELLHWADAFNFDGVCLNWPRLDCNMAFHPPDTGNVHLNTELTILRGSCNGYHAAHFVPPLCMALHLALEHHGRHGRHKFFESGLAWPLMRSEQALSCTRPLRRKGHSGLRKNDQPRRRLPEGSGLAWSHPTAVHPGSGASTGNQKVASGTAAYLRITR